MKSIFLFFSSTFFLDNTKTVIGILVSVTVTIVVLAAFYFVIARCRKSNITTTRNNNVRFLFLNKNIKKEGSFFYKIFFFKIHLFINISKQKNGASYLYFYYKIDRSKVTFFQSSLKGKLRLLKRLLDFCHSCWSVSTLVCCSVG